MTRTVDASVESVFEAFTSYKDIQAKLPEVFPSVVMKSRRGNVFVTEEHRIFMGKEIVILAKHVLNPLGSHQTIFLGGNFKGTKITENFSYSNGKTTINIEIKLNRNILHRLFNIDMANKIRKETEKYADNLLSLVQ